LRCCRRDDDFCAIRKFFLMFYCVWSWRIAKSMACMMRRSWHCGLCGRHARDYIRPWLYSQRIAQSRPCLLSITFFFVAPSAQNIRIG
jgi:hypothetical protein